MKVIAYWFRISAVLLLVGFVVFATSLIGEPRTSCEPMTWIGMWTGAGNVAAFMFISFLAGRESKEAA